MFVKKKKNVVGNDRFYSDWFKMLFFFDNVRFSEKNQLLTISLGMIKMYKEIESGLLDCHCQRKKERERKCSSALSRPHRRKCAKDHVSHEANINVNLKKKSTRGTPPPSNVSYVRKKKSAGIQFI